MRRKSDLKVRDGKGVNGDECYDTGWTGGNRWIYGLDDAWGSPSFVSATRIGNVDLPFLLVLAERVKEIRRFV